jgi:Ras-related protein Rab-1A
LNLISKESFDNIKIWLEEIDRYGNNDTKKLLVGNKSDLKSKRVIEYKIGKVCYTKKIYEIIFILF